MNLILKLAARNILRNKRRTILTVLLISMTLAILIFTDGYMKAMADVMIRSATRLYPGDGQIHQVDYLPEYNAEKLITDVDGIIDNVKRSPLVDSYSIRAMDFGMVSSSANNLPVQVVGIDADLEATVSKLRLSIIAGNYLSMSGADNQILMGQALANLMEVSLNDRLVVSLNNYHSNEIEQRLFRVSGIYKMNSTFFDEGLIFIKLNQAQTMLGIGLAVHEVAFNFKDESLSSDNDLPLWQNLSSDTVVAEGWKKLMPDLASMIGMFDFSMLIVAVILFSVAILGVINAMFMSIYERTYEFGVMLAIGTRRYSLFKLILAEGLILSLISLMFGSIIGAIVTVIMSHVGIDYGSMEISGVALAEVLRPQLATSQFIIFPVAVFLMTMVASVYPAIHAARIVPAAALHKSL